MNLTGSLEPPPRISDALLRVWTATSASRPAIAAAWLDGLPAQQLRNQIDLATRRREGIYLTGAPRAAALLRGLGSVGADGTSVLDPACGTGDLLVSLAKRLPVAPTPDDTLKLWGRILNGWDVRQDLVDIAKHRLALLAAVRSLGPAQEMPDLDGSLMNIRVSDGLLNLSEGRRFTHIVMNPPFGNVVIGSGLRSRAAEFLEKAVTALHPDGQLFAILPDVIRSGTRYRATRELVERSGTVRHIELLGQFDQDADIDVFSLILVNRAASGAQNWYQVPAKTGRPCLGDTCSVTVGPVVPHRHMEVGPPHPYVNARILLGRPQFDLGSAPVRRFSGTLVAPPFVVIRRTSRPDDLPRANATVVTGSKPAAVENHLIVLKPERQSIAACRQVAELVKSQVVTEWLNKRLRCRHLTVSAIREIEWN